MLPPVLGSTLSVEAAAGVAAAPSAGVFTVAALAGVAAAAAAAGAALEMVTPFTAGALTGVLEESPVATAGGCVQS